MYTALELYEALVAAGVEEHKAKAATEAVLSREEANAILATKEDILDVRKDLNRVIMWVAGMMVAQIVAITGIMGWMFNLYS